RAMLPVNVRRSDEHLKLGNRVSMLVVPLPVRIFDPLERLRQVRAATAHLKERGQAARFTRVLDLMEFLPAAVQKPLGWLELQAGFEELRVLAGVERVERHSPVLPERQRRAAAPSQVA